MSPLFSMNQSVQKENNLSLVIRTILSCPDENMSRVKLAEQTGLTQASITKIVAQLIEWGVVYESESIQSVAGRKPIRLLIDAEKYLVLAMRINRVYLHAVLYDIAGKKYWSKRVAILPSDGPEFAMKRLKEIMREGIDAAASPVLIIGIAVPGPFNSRTGRISLMSGFGGWNAIDIGQELEDTFHLPVVVEHDANCGALAELWYGGCKPDANLLYILADKGIGAGIIINGNVYSGQLGFAGEIGHTSVNIFGPLCECGNHGCLELYCSTQAIEEAYRKELFARSAGEVFPSDLDAQDVLSLVRAGDPIACEVYARTVRYLAFGVAGVIKTLNPEIIVFSDKLVEGGDLFLTTVKQTLKQYLMPELQEAVDVRVSNLGADPMPLGASVVAVEHMLRSPSTFFRRV